ncbi:MAG: (2Fe-2S)-binding protein [Chloroflexota bacterium]|nr:(2Fe-2S)-binding protein [Chloroflexota bacterium]
MPARHRPATFVGPGPVDVALDVNGRRVALHVPPRRTLLDALRDELGLTATKKVCDEGTCGACTVLVDGRPVYSCMTLAIACEGRAVETLESLNGDGRLHPLQRAFVDHDAFQCGFCTPGQLMSLVALLRENARPTEDDVKRAVAGNLCRCGAYPKIVAAGLAAARRTERAERLERERA